MRCGCHHLSGTIVFLQGRWERELQLYPCSHALPFKDKQQSLFNTRKEIIDMSTDEESDCVVICSAGVGPKKGNGHASKTSQSSGSDEVMEGVSDSQYLHRTIESEDYQVKYNTLDGPVKAPLFCGDEEEPPINDLNLGTEKSELMKANNSAQKLTDHVFGYSNA